jgi:hypothetical protein
MSAAIANANQPTNAFAAILRGQCAHGRRGRCSVTADGQHHYVTGRYRNGGEVSICLCGHMTEGGYVGITWKHEIGEPCSLFAGGQHHYAERADVSFKDPCTASLCPCGHERTFAIWS